MAKPPHFEPASPLAERLRLTLEETQRYTESWEERERVYKRAGRYASQRGKTIHVVPSYGEVPLFSRAPKR